MSEMSSSTSSRDDESRDGHARHSAPVPLYEVYHGEDSEAEVEEELREREQDYNFRASRTRPFPSSSSSHTSQYQRISPPLRGDGDMDVRYANAEAPSHKCARLPVELYSLIASFVLSERPIAKIHTFRKSPWRIIVGATLASKAMRSAFMTAWFRVLRIRQVGDFNHIDQKMGWMFPWVREIHWHYRFPITCNETHVLPKFLHAVLISFKTSDNRLGNEHYMTMVHRAIPHLGSVPTLTRLSLTCRSLFDPKFLDALATSWPALECLRLARPLKDENDMKAFILYRYDFTSYEAVVERLVQSLRKLKNLAYIAIDLSFADFRLMRATHMNNSAAPSIPTYVNLPKSLRVPSRLDKDGDTEMGDATTGQLEDGIVALHVTNGTTAPLTAANLALALYPTSHNPNCTALECAFCLRSFRAHSYYIEHEVARGLGVGLPSLAAVRFRASFPQTSAGDAKENKWLIKRTLEKDATGGIEEEAVIVWAPRWE
ncbi:hypothetical protein FRB91_007171 [Serendipita sp. 411]|nr:hypothetical protein FRB91_007171 [Serendipita sp. 411]